MPTKLLKILVCNANGLSLREPELKLFIQSQNLDIVLILETHFTSSSYLNIPNNDLFTTNHPSGRRHGCTGILVKNHTKVSNNSITNLVTSNP